MVALTGCAGAGSPPPDPVDAGLAAIDASAVNPDPGLDASAPGRDAAMAALEDACAPEPSADAQAAAGPDATTAGLDAAAARLDAGSPDAALAPMTPLDMCRLLYRGGLARLADCLRSSRDALYAWDGADFTCEELAVAVADGRVTYAESQARACLDLFAQEPCGKVVNAPWYRSPCDLVFKGRIEADDQCFHDFDCNSQAFCAMCHSTCGGVCKPFLLPGETCSHSDIDSRCAPGAICSPGNVCEALGQAGQPCDTSLGPSCDSGLFCSAGITGGSGTCQPLLQAGEACSGYLECDYLLQCAGLLGGMTGVCQRVKSEGTRCTFGEEECAFLEYCSADQVCTVFSQLDGICGMVPAPASCASGGCGPVSESSQCLDGYCGLAPGAAYGRCVRYRDLGETCPYCVMGYGSCGRAARCDASSLTCIAICLEP